MSTKPYNFGAHPPNVITDSLGNIATINNLLPLGGFLQNTGPGIVSNGTVVSGITNDAGASSAVLVEGAVPITTGTATIKSLTAGTSIGITNGANTVTVTNSNPFPVYSGSAAAQYWVGKNGSDANMGGPEDPFLTIGHAISVINANGDAGSGAEAKIYTIVVNSGNYDETLLLPPFVMLCGLTTGYASVLNVSAGTLSLDTAKWDSGLLPAPPVGGFGNITLGGSSTYDLSGTVLPAALYVFNIAIIGAPSTFNGNTNSNVYITTSEFFSVTCNGGSVNIYSSVLSSSPSTFANSASAVMKLRLENTRVGANMLLDAFTHVGALTAYLGSVCFDKTPVASTLTINGAAAVVHATIDSFPAVGNLILQNGAADMVLWNNDAIRHELGGTGISVLIANGISTITNTGVTSAVAGTGIGVSGATGAVTFSNTGVITVDGDTGAASANTITLSAKTTAGSSTSFTVSGTTLDLNTTDSNGNTIIGSSAGNGTISGTDNVGYGANSLHALTSGGNNVAFGFNSLTNLLSGSGNIAIGTSAGSGYTGTEASNILIGNTGTLGESSTIRIGQAQTSCYVQGISGITVAGAVPVVIGGSGQMGTVVSSRRYKNTIADMGMASSPIMNLRPVTFIYNDDNHETRQYGLIAEEVEEVLPGLVVYDKDDLPMTVQYQNLVPMLLNEIQKLNRRIEQLENLAK